MTNPTGTDMEMARELREIISDFSEDLNGRFGTSHFIDQDDVSVLKAAATRLEGLTISDEMVERAARANVETRNLNPEDEFEEIPHWKREIEDARHILTAALTPLEDPYTLPGSLLK